MLRQFNPYAQAIMGVVDWATRNGVEIANIQLRIDEQGTTAAVALLGPAGAGPHRTR
jgi:hypothetical protein